MGKFGKTQLRLLRELSEINTALEQTSYWKATEKIELELKRLTILNNLAK